MKRCRHTKAYDVGQTQWGMSEAFVYWCPECGAIRKEMTSWKYSKSRWKKPARKEQP